MDDDRILSDHPKAVDSRRRRRLLRSELSKLIGRRCEECGSRENIEPHHRAPRTWKSAKLWTINRLKRYIEDAKAGKVRALCSDCNKLLGPPVAGDVDF